LEKGDMDCNNAADKPDCLFCGERIEEEGGFKIKKDGNIKFFILTIAILSNSNNIPLLMLEPEV
jgi:hypothetical protein